MAKFIDITGQRFGRLIVIERSTKRGKQVYWRCMCDCGDVSVVRGSCLRCGNTKSCGCLNLQKMNERRTRHGKHRERIYQIWLHMRQRCANPKDPSYYLYGGRGISVCKEWGDFMTFYRWAMDEGYSENLTIDRIDNNGNYTPENCRWTTRHQQQANTRRNSDFVGVSFCKDTNDYEARLNKDGKCVFRKHFKTKERAISARLQVEELFGIVIQRKQEEQK